jgi:hypothetical protein
MTQKASRARSGSREDKELQVSGIKDLLKIINK